MLLPPQSLRFDEFSVAVPDFIRYPTIRKLAERVQHATLNAVPSPALYDGSNTSRSARILDS